MQKHTLESLSGALAPFAPPWIRQCTTGTCTGTGSKAFMFVTLHCLMVLPVPVQVPVVKLQPTYSRSDRTEK